MAGYSQNPLSKKLGFKPGQHVMLINPPAHYRELIGDILSELHVKAAGATNLDFIHIFTNSEAELRNELSIAKDSINKAGAIWVSWYKKSAKKETELTEDIIRNIALDMGLVDVKVRYRRRVVGAEACVQAEGQITSVS